MGSGANHGLLAAPLLAEHAPPAVVAADPPRRPVREHQTCLAGLIGQEPVTELRVIAMSVEHGGSQYAGAPVIIRRELNQAVFKRFWLIDDEIAGASFTTLIERLKTATVSDIQKPESAPEKRKNLCPEDTGSNEPLLVVLERAWSNLSTRSAVPPPEIEDEPAPVEPGRRTRVTPQLRADVVRRYQGGEPSRVVAEELRICKATVLKVLRAEGVELKPVGVRY